MPVGDVESHQGDAGPHADTDSDAHADSHPDAHTDSDAHAHTDSDAHADPDAHSDAHADADADADPTPTITGETVVIAEEKQEGKAGGQGDGPGLHARFQHGDEPYDGRLCRELSALRDFDEYVKKKLTTLHTPVAFTAAYNPATNSVTLMISGKQAFATGGQITVNYSPPGGVSSATDEPLAANDASFAIAAKGSSIAPG